MNKSKRTVIAYETLDVLKAGSYMNQKNETVDISNALKHSVDHTILYKADEFNSVFLQRDKLLTTVEPYHTRFVVTGETTFDAARRLITTEGNSDVCCLNFASAKNPGGGFLGGAQAQEEALARASGLYASLLSKREMYDINRAGNTCLYTDNMIYSPLVPVFREENGTLLDRPYLVSVITSPAANAGAIKNNEPHRLKDIEAVMLRRIEKLLSVAVIQGQTTLILGAWGCGVFRNNPGDIAAWFASYLLEHPLFKQAFRQVVFAVYDSSEKQVNKKAFQHKFEYHEV